MQVSIPPFGIESHLIHKMVGLYQESPFQVYRSIVWRKKMKKVIDHLFLQLETVNL